ncbi:hypothetical protein ACFVQ4_03235 [Streptomyces laurentii]|uniref:hypothetical protein n=1 Tax=Streptomyces laurentii TaxID=39478 RepID=UPI003689713B
MDDETREREWERMRARARATARARRRNQWGAVAAGLACALPVLAVVYLPLLLFVDLRGTRWWFPILACLSAVTGTLIRQLRHDRRRDWSAGRE